jgi:hypothetical protein
VFSDPWHVQSLSFDSLKPVLQHRTIMFAQNILSYTDLVVGVDTNNVTIKSGMMEFAEGDAV